MQTPEAVYLSRRHWLKSSAAAVSMAAISGQARAQPWDDTEGPTRQTNAALRNAPDWLWAKVQDARPLQDPAQPEYLAQQKPTPRVFASSYNNFYEFGFDKSDPEKHASEYQPFPHQVRIEGLVLNPGTYSLRELVEPQRLENRMYRLRCVEAWSMVIPWVGFPLSALLEMVQPTEDARWVAFETALDKGQMPGTRSFFSTIDWPYREGLRLDEAMHPLTLMAVGMYGRPLPGQNGAPMRLVVPWKYGFKSIKSVVRIELTHRQPPTTWNLSQPREYGFYANVNPEVDHPRWSQKRERVLPSESVFFSNWKPTEKFNGYGEQVAHLYRGMDLRRFY